MSKALALIIASLALSLIAAELSAALYHRIDTGLWLPENPGPPPAAADTGAKPPRMMLSPYYGAVFRPGRTASEDGKLADLAATLGLKDVPAWMHDKANSFGFMSPVDYPYTPAPDEFIVGVFGSSVANQFSQQGAARLAEALRQLPGMSTRKVRVLSFAVGGQKQPQQLLALSYFYSLGQKFDLVVNLDGINEAWGAWWNLERAHIDWSLPLAHLLLGAQDMLSKCCTEDIVKLSKVDARQRRAEWRAANTHSALIHYGAKAYANLLAVEAAQLQGAVSLTHPQVNYIIVARPDQSTFEQNSTAMVENWTRASIGMSNIARAMGASYVHILPPNQYASKKQLTPDEQRVAFFDNWVGDVYRRIVPPTYAAMRAERSNLERGGVAFLDATETFDQSNEWLYLDGGGHYRQRGYELLAERLAAFVRERGALKTH